MGEFRGLDDGGPTTPALTPSDTTILPRVDRAEGSATREVLGVVDAPTFLEGEGFKVRRAFADIDLSFADLLLLLDHMGAVEYAPHERRGLRIIRTAASRR